MAIKLDQDDNLKKTTINFEHMVKNQNFGFHKLNVPKGKKLNKWLIDICKDFKCTSGKERKPDKNDLCPYSGRQIYHYEITDTFRVHGYLQGSVFYVNKIDPNHKMHE